MRDDGPMASSRSRRPRWSRPQPGELDALPRLDADIADILALLNRVEATQRIVATVPDGAGVDAAWFGDPAGLDDGSVPIVAGDRLLGLLYRADRDDADRDDADRDDADRDDDTGRDRATDALQRMVARTATAQVIAERARHAAQVAVHDERRKLALDLHDSVGAMLFTLGAGIRRLSAEPGLSDEVRARLSIIERQAGAASAALRGSLRILSTPPEPVALCVALRQHCRAFQARTGVPARLITLTDLPPVSAAGIAALGDTVRESMLGIERRAQAKLVVVTVFAGPDGVTVTVSDDGSGLSDADPATGLAAASDAVARAGGSLTVSANDDGGATVRAWVPR
jgi:signal transduction histidine kinase